MMVLEGEHATLVGLPKSKYHLVCEQHSALTPMTEEGGKQQQQNKQILKRNTHAVLYHINSAPRGTSK